MIVRLGEIWFCLQSFSLAMATVQMGLENYMSGQRADPGGESTNTQAEDDVEAPTDDLEEKDGMDVKNQSLQEFWESHEKGATEEFPVRPAGVDEAEWKVYRSVVLLRTEFDTKWRTMWA